MADELVQDHDVSRSALWIGLLGGGVAWLAHLLFAYAVAEFGCLTEFGHRQFAGITYVAWMLIIVSIVTALGAAASAWIAVRTIAKFPLDEADIAETRGTGHYMARTGVYSSIIFIVIIAVQTVPIFFYLKDC
jgi:hypothetical protein